MKKRKIIEVLMPIVILLIFIGLLFYILNDYLIQSKNLLKRNQQLETNRISNILEIFNTGEESEQEIVTELERIYPASSSHYAILLKAKEIIFIKDDVTTDEVHMSSEECLEKLRQQNTVITECRFLIGQQEYTLYLVSSENYGIYQMGLDTFYINLSILIVMTSVLVLCYIIKINISRQKLRRQVEEQKKQMRNLLLNEESLNEQLFLERRKSKEDNVLGGNVRTYNLHMVDMLLSKSKDEKLQPFFLMVIKLYLGERYYSKDEMDLIQTSIQSHLNENQILCEIGKGEYCILLYKTESVQVKQLRADLLNQWRKKPEFRQYLFKIKAREVEETDAKEVFVNLRAEVQNMIKKGSHSYAV